MSALVRQWWTNPRAKRKAVLKNVKYFKKYLRLIAILRPLTKIGKNHLKNRQFFYKILFNVIVGIVAGAVIWAESIRVFRLQRSERY
jgi:hypothetical protein